MPIFNVQKALIEITQGAILTIDRVADPAPFLACKDKNSITVLFCCKKLSVYAELQVAHAYLNNFCPSILNALSQIFCFLLCEGARRLDLQCITKFKISVSKEISACKKVSVCISAKYNFVRPVREEAKLSPRHDLQQQEHLLP